MKIFITGAIGFLGTRLAQHLVRLGHAVTAYEGDVLNYPLLCDQLAAVRPEVVFHFAGISDVGSCENDPELAYRVNVHSVSLLYESLTRAQLKTHVVFPSTAHVYDFTVAPASGSYSESSQVKPTSTYGRTKWAAENMIRGFEHLELITTSVFRLFNVTHKSQSVRFFLPSVVDQLLKSCDSPVRVPVGNIELYRDLSPIEDYLDAFATEVTATHHDRLAVYNLASGQPRLLKNVAEALARVIGKRAEFLVDPVRVRKIEAQSIVGDSTRFQNARGWRPQTLTDIQFAERVLKD